MVIFRCREHFEDTPMARKKAGECHYPTTAYQCLLERNRLAPMSKRETAALCSQLGRAILLEELYFLTRRPFPEWNTDSWSRRDSSIEDCILTPSWRIPP